MARATRNFTDTATLMRWVILALVCLFAFLALALAVYPALRIFSASSVNFNEGWNAYLQVRAASGQPLYSGYSPFFFCNYPPVSFYLIGWLGQMFGDVVLAGRLISLISLAAIAAACGHIVRSSGGGRLEYAFAAFTCLLSFLTFYDVNVGADEPQMLGMAFTVWGLALHIAGPQTLRRTALVVLLLGFAVLTKHHLLAIPVIVTVDVLLRGNAKLRLTYLGFVLAMALASAVVLWIREGPQFYTQTLAPRMWSEVRAAENSGHFLANNIFPVLVCAALAFLRSRTGWLVLAYLALSFGLGVFFSGGAGVGGNIFQECVIALAIGSGLIIARMQPMIKPGVAVVFVMLLANFMPLISAPEELKADHIQLRTWLPLREKLFADDVAYLRSKSGAALCEDNMLCFRAGKPMNVDAFNTQQAVLTGRLPSGSLDSLIDQDKFGVVMIYPRPAADGMTTGNFEQTFYFALDRNYHLTRDGSMQQFWEPWPVKH